MSLKESITKRTKIVVWAICLFISSIAIAWFTYEHVTEKKREAKKDKKDQYYQRLLERQELRAMGQPQVYINGLGESPLLKHHFNKGEKLEGESRYEEAITEYRKCLHHPQATAANKTAAHNITGACYYRLSRLTEAEQHYRESLRLTRKIADRNEKKRAKAAALGNMGLIYRVKGELDNALEYLKQALKINKEIGDKKGQAADLVNIGNIYYMKGDLDNAMKYYQQAEAIFKTIGAIPQLKIVQDNINLAKSAMKSQKPAPKNPQIP